jgi:hypothetical protein
MTPAAPKFPGNAKPRRAATHWRGRPVLDQQHIRDLYTRGLSCTDVGRIVGASRHRVWKICRDIARNKHDAALLKVKPSTSTHWRTCRANARKIMARKLGRKLLHGEEVHHKDENYTNNAVDNLEVLTVREHRHRHRPPNPTPRHLRPARQAYMKAYLKEYNKTYVRRRSGV